MIPSEKAVVVVLIEEKDPEEDPEEDKEEALQEDQGVVRAEVPVVDQQAGRIKDQETVARIGRDRHKDLILARTILLRNIYNSFV